MPEEHPQIPASKAGAQKPRSLRRALFYLSLLTATVSLTCYFWPIDRNPLIQVIGPDGKVGAVTSGGRVAIEPEWDVIGEFLQAGIAKARRDNQIVWIDRKGNIVIPSNYFVLSPETFDSDGLARFVYDDKSGIIDSRGEIVVRPKWDAIGAGFDEHGLIRVERNSKVGWVDKKDNVVIEPIWDAALPFDPEGMAAVRSFDKWGWINTRGGLEVLLEWHNIHPIWAEGDSGHLDVNSVDSELHGNPYGITSSGLIETTRESVRYFDSHEMARVRKDSQWGCIDRGGEVNFAMESFTPPVFNSFGLVQFVLGGRYGWKNRRGEVVIDPIWNLAGEFNEHGLAMVWLNGSRTWINTEGTPLAPSDWDYTSEFDGHGMARVRKDSRWGWIDTSGKLVLPLTWDDSKPFDSEGMAQVKENERWGWINVKGKMVKNPQFEELTEFNEYGLATFTEDSKNYGRQRFGLVNRKGEVIAECVWNKIAPFDSEGMAAVRSKELRWGWINQQGEVVIEPNYDEIAYGPRVHSMQSLRFPSFDRQGMARVRIEERWGWINRQGDQVIPAIYKRTENFDPNGNAVAVRFAHNPSLIATHYDKYVETSSFALIPGDLIKRNGEPLVTLPGNEWLWRLPNRGPGPGANTGVNIPAYVAVCYEAPVNLVRKWRLSMYRFLFDGESDSPLNDTEIASIVYNLEGELIWDSRWVRFETKCIAALVFALLLAVLTKPRKPRQDSGLGSR